MIAKTSYRRLQINAVRHAAAEMNVSADTLSLSEELQMLFAEKVNDLLPHPFHLQSSECLEVLRLLENHGTES